MTGYEALFDELNVLFDEKVKEYIKKTTEGYDYLDDYEDYLFTLMDNQDEFEKEMQSFFREQLIRCYQISADDVAEELGFPPFPDLYNGSDEVINKEIEGKTYSDRVHEYAIAGEIDRLRVVLNTESHRVYTTAGQITAESTQDGTVEGQSGEGGISTYPNTKSSYNAIMKHWETMKDPKVRETHEYLQSMSVPLRERFYTIDGDSALYPSDFGNPENNINCRCWVTYSYL